MQGVGIVRMFDKDFTIDSPGIRQISRHMARQTKFKSLLQGHLFQHCKPEIKNQNDETRIDSQSAIARSMERLLDHSGGLILNSRQSARNELRYEAFAV